MTKRMNGEGSVFYSQTRGWCAKITDLDGRRITRKADTQTKGGAERLLRQLLLKRDSLKLDRQTVTLERYLPEWLEAARVRGCRPRSIEAYTDKLRTHALPLLGRTQLSKITPAQVEKVYAGMLDAGLSPKSVDLLHTALNGVMKHAMRHEVILRNPLERVERPKVQKFEARPLSVDDARKLLGAVRRHKYGALWAFLLATGTRYGEGAGLAWDCVDFEAGTVVIRQAAVRTRANGKCAMELAEPKTAAGRRTLPVPSWLLGMLRTQRSRAAEMRLAAGPVWADYNLVFPSAIGTPLRESHVREAWIPFLEAEGLPKGTRMHDLRHTFATLSLDDGADLVAVSRTLGHSRVGITVDIYTAGIPAAQRRLVDRYSELLGKVSEASG